MPYGPKNTVVVPIANNIATNIECIIFSTFQLSHKPSIEILYS